ncbi:MAG: hypothetical protein O3B42_05675 [Actinomycetota bacterium]|nr:hypothetical protein [Actinomycetota bacterium]
MAPIEANMKLFKRDTGARRTDKDYDESVNNRMRAVLGKDTEHVTLPISGSRELQLVAQRSWS